QWERATWDVPVAALRTGRGSSPVFCSKEGRNAHVRFEKKGNIPMAQTMLVTGSSSGFGRLTVETLARQGYTVFAGMRTVTGKNAPAAEALRALAEREQLALQIVE